MTEPLRYLLDTDMISYALRGMGDVGLTLRAKAPSEICVSSLSVAELRYGAEKRKSKKLHRLIDAFLAPLGVVPFDDVAAREYGRMAAALAARGTPIGTFDTLIAAQAMALQLTLVTHNQRQFQRVRGLSLEDWWSCG